MAVRDRARRSTVTGRSAAPKLDRPSMAWLRLRAMFGISARAEILRYLLAKGEGRASMVTISTAINYTKRNVAEEREALEHAGVLAVRPAGNRFYYSLAKRTELEAFIGAMPRIRPSWTTVLNVARKLVDIEDLSAGSTSRTLAVKARKAIDEIEPDLDELDIDPPTSDTRATELWPAMRTPGTETLGTWSLGYWHRPQSREATGGSTVPHIS